jgi:sortase A
MNEGDAAVEPPEGAPKRRRLRKRQWIALLTALGIVLAAGITTAAVVGSGNSHKASEEDLPTFLPSSTAQTSTTVKVHHKAIVLSKPAAPPADPYANVPVVQIGTLEIPKIGELTPIYEGITLTVIDHGPGHWPGTALPGQPGNTVFPGHRVTHTHPFLNLDLLTPGDHVIFHMPGNDYVYKVTGTQIVYPTDLWVTNPTPGRTFTLIACHPKHSAAQRIVVKGTFLADIKR